MTLHFENTVHAAIPYTIDFQIYHETMTQTRSILLPQGTKYVRGPPITVKYNDHFDCLKSRDSLPDHIDEGIYNFYLPTEKTIFADVHEIKF